MPDVKPGIRFALAVLFVRRIEPLCFYIVILICILGHGGDS
jgi:hypothetical protein